MLETKVPSITDTLTGRGPAAPRILSGNSVIAEPLFNHQSIPFLIRPGAERVNLPAWAGTNLDFIESWLLHYGAILFRGFEISGVEEFQAFAEATSSNGLLDYTFRSTPRKKVSGKIYTSTEYPADQSIPLHNEMSYARSWPMKIWFYCLKPPARGGATTLADSGRVLERIDPQVKTRFIRSGVRYVRNYRDGLDLSCREVFGTDDRSVIERLCQEADIECEFGGERQLRTRQTCQVIAVHPKARRAVWFNQAHLFHVSSLNPGVSKQLLALYGEGGLPRNCYYSDGSSINEADLHEIRAAYTRETVTFPWEEGDILMLDNMLVAHGRDPFAGERKVVVAMAEQYGISS